MLHRPDHTRCPMRFPFQSSQQNQNLREMNKSCNWDKSLKRKVNRIPKGWNQWRKQRKQPWKHLREVILQDDPQTSKTQPVSSIAKHQQLLEVQLTPVASSPLHQSLPSTNPYHQHQNPKHMDSVFLLLNPYILITSQINLFLFLLLLLGQYISTMRWLEVLSDSDKTAF